MTKRWQRPAYKINLIRQHQICETNYLRLKKMLPGLETEDHIHLKIQHGTGSTHLDTDVFFDVMQRSPYTTLLRVYMKASWGNWIVLPDFEIRMYHDVQMAEVVFTQTSKRLEPSYGYPNPKMHQPNEKEQLNQFLAEWLDFCFSGGLIPDSVFQIST